MAAKQPTYDDANLILRLYDMRREPRLRQARAWMGSQFKARTLQEWQQACPPGSEENASFRMAVTYWEMVGSFVASGVLNAQLFFQSGQEILFIWEKVRDIVPALRDANKNPKWLGNLERVARMQAEFMGPEAYQAFSARVRGA